MYHIAEQPELPIIWLDTHAVSMLTTAQESANNDSLTPGHRRTLELLLELRRAGHVLVFESDQLYEIESAPGIAERCARVLAQLSQGVRASYAAVHRAETRLGMRACIEQQPAPIPIPWRTAFDRDPFDDYSVGGRFIVRARFEPDQAELDRRRTVYRSISNEWEALRNAQAGEPFQVRFDGQLARERQGRHEALTRLVAERLRRDGAGDELSVEDLLRDANLFGRPLREWQELGGHDLPGMLGFYTTSYYGELPHVDIWSNLAAWRIAGAEPIRPSDVMDIHHISAFLPYSTHMVLDRSMINAVRTLGLDVRYGTTVGRLQELNSILEATSTCLSEDNN